VLTTEGTWITALNFHDKSFSYFADAAGKIFYSLALITAVFVLIRYARRSPTGPRDRKILSSLVDVIGWATLFFLTDLSLLPWLITPLWIAYGVIPVALWLCFHRTPWWPLVRSFLVVLYLPVLVYSYSVLVFPVTESVIGYLLLFFGSQLLWLGLAQIAAEAKEKSLQERGAAETELATTP
jgi:hypothetical protein